MQETIFAELDTLFGSVLDALGVNQDLDLHRFSNLVDMIEAALLENASRPAFTSLGKTITYGELDRLSGDFASYLQNHTDLLPGDRIAVQTPNLIQYPVVVFGALP